MMDWDGYFLNIAETVSLKSKDLSTKLGSVIVGPKHEIRSTGYNALPRGVQDDPDNPDFRYRFERPEKYKWVVHSEVNAILNAARVGTAVEGCAIYTKGFPCIECAKAIINAGITKVIYNQKHFDNWTSMQKGGTYHDDIQKTYLMFSESGIGIWGLIL
jgi:dCMP deaminase